MIRRVRSDTFVPPYDNDKSVSSARPFIFTPNDVVAPSGYIICTRMSTADNSLDDGNKYRKTKRLRRPNAGDGRLFLISFSSVTRAPTRQSRVRRTIVGPPQKPRVCILTRTRERADHTIRRASKHRNTSATDGRIFSRRGTRTRKKRANFFPHDFTWSTATRRFGPFVSRRVDDCRAPTDQPR